MSNTESPESVPMETQQTDQDLVQDRGISEENLVDKTSSTPNDQFKEPSQVITFGTDAQQKISPSESCASVSSHEMVWKVPDGIKKSSVVFSPATGEENTAQTSEPMEGTNISTCENLVEAPVTPNDPMGTEELMDTDQPLERTNAEDPEVSRDNSRITNETFLKPAFELETKTMVAPLEGSCSTSATAPLATESQPIVYSREHLENTIITALKMLDNALRSFGEVPAIHYEMHKETKEKLLVILNSIGILSQDSKSEDLPLPDDAPQNASTAELDGSLASSHKSEHGLPTTIKEVSTETPVVVSPEREIWGTENELIVATCLNAIHHSPESNDTASVVMEPSSLEEDANDSATSCESLECVEVVPHEVIEAPPELMIGPCERPPHLMDLDEAIVPEELLGRSGYQSPDVSSDENNEVHQRSPSREDLQNMIIRESLPATGSSGDNISHTPPELPTAVTYTSRPATDVQDQLEPVESTDGSRASPHERLDNSRDSIDDSCNVPPYVVEVEVETTETQDESRVSPQEGLDKISAAESCDSLQCSSISSDICDDSSISSPSSVESLHVVDDISEYSNVSSPSSEETRPVADDISECSSICSSSSEEKLHVVDDISEYSNVSSPSSGETRDVADDISEHSSISSSSSEESLHDADDNSEYSNVSSPRSVDDDVREYSDISSSSSEEILPITEDISEYSNISSSLSDVETTDASDSFESSGFSSRETLIATSDVTNNYPDIDSMVSVQGLYDVNDGSIMACSESFAIATDDADEAVNICEAPEEQQTSTEAQERADVSAYDVHQVAEAEEAMEADESLGSANVSCCQELPIDVPNDTHVCPSTLPPQVDKQTRDLEGTPKSLSSSAHEITTQDLTSGFDCMPSLSMDVETQELDHNSIHPPAVEMQGPLDTDDSKGCRSSPSDKSVEVVSDAVADSVNIPPSLLKVESLTQLSGQPCGFEIAEPEWSCVTTHKPLDTAAEVTVEDDTSSTAMDIKPCVVQESFVMPADDIIATVSQVVTEGQHISYPVMSDVQDVVEAREPLECFNVSLRNQVNAAAGGIIGISDSVFEEQNDTESNEQQGDCNVTPDVASASYNTPTLEELQNAPLPEEQNETESKEQQGDSNVTPDVASASYNTPTLEELQNDPLPEEQNETESKEQQGDSNVTPDVASASYNTPTLEELQNAPLPDEPCGCANIPIYDALHTSPEVICDARYTFPPTMDISSEETTESLVSSDKIAHSYEAPFSQPTEMEVELNETTLDSVTLQPVQQTISAGFQPMAPSGNNGYSNLSHLNHNALGSVRKHVKAAYDILFEEDEGQPPAKVKRSDPGRVSDGRNPAGFRSNWPHRSRRKRVWNGEEFVCEDERESGVPKRKRRRC